MIPRQSYYHDIDILRGLMMGLGVVLHAGVYFSGTESPKVDLDLDAPVYGHIVQFIHFFRMQAFFMLAGFFAAMISERYSFPQLMQRRAIKLLVPMLTCALTFNLVMGFLNQSGLDSENPLSLKYWLSGNWLAHLWFLPNLFVYTIIFTAFDQKLRWRPPVISTALALLVLYLTYPVIKFLLHRIAWQLDFWPWGDRILGVFDPKKLLGYSLDFATGIMLWKLNLLRQLSRARALQFHLAAGFAIGWVIYGLPDALANDYVLELAGLAFALPLAFGLIGLMSIIFSRPSRWGKFSADASYTLYLLHMPLLALIATVLQPLNLTSAHVAYAIMCSATLVIAVAAHPLIMQHRLSALLLNGHHNRPARRIDNTSDAQAYEGSVGG